MAEKLEDEEREQGLDTIVSVDDHHMLDLKGRPVNKATSGRWRAASFLLAYEICERMSFYGIAVNLVVYLTEELHEGTVDSARNVNNWSGAIWMTPVLGAYLADTYLGRYSTFTFFSFIYLIGMGLLTMAVSLPSLKPPPCDEFSGLCPPASTSQVGFFYFSLYLLCVGTGGTKPNISTFGADQFDEKDLKEKALKSSFFNWWMFSICFGVILAQTVLVYIQDNVGWGWGYGILTLVLLLSLGVFLVGTPFYRHKKPYGSPLSEILQVFVAATLKWQNKVPFNYSLLHELDLNQYSRMGKTALPHSSRYGCLDKAAVKTESSKEVEEGRWRLCTVTQVEETKMVVGMISVWVGTLMFTAVISNVLTFFVRQGQTMDRRVLGSAFEIPPASLGAFLTASMLILVPLYDIWLVPMFQRITGKERGISLLQRIGIGMFFQIIVMVVAALVEKRRLVIASEHNLLDFPHATVPMSIFWLVPQFLLMGVADTFTNIAVLEFFYDQAPMNMKSIGTAIYTTNMGVGYFMSSLLITGVSKLSARWNGGSGWLVDNLNRSNLDYYYWVLSLLISANALIFVGIAKRFKYYNNNNNCCAATTPNSKHSDLSSMPCPPLPLDSKGLASL